MKKKILSIFLVFAVFGAVNVFAIGFGAQAGFNIGGGPNGALTFKLNQKSSPIFAVDLGFTNQSFALGLTADWWIANPTITGPWGYFYGIGAGGSILFGDPAALSIGPRFVLGTNVFLIHKFLELYLQAAWQPNLNVVVGNESGGIGFNWIYFPINLGFRFWF